MQRSDWRGVYAAITTPFSKNGHVDHGFLREHIEWLVTRGVRGTPDVQGASDRLDAGWLHRRCGLQCLYQHAVGRDL